MDYVRELRALVGSRLLLLPASTILIFDGAGQVLLQRRGDDGCWGIPGGAMEPGETFEDTARREALEETGLTIGRLTLVDVYSGPEFRAEYPNGDQVYSMGCTYLAGEVRGTPTADGDETIELAYFSLDALPADLLPTSRLLLNRYRMTSYERSSAQT